MEGTGETVATAAGVAATQTGILRCDRDLVVTDASLTLCRFLARRRHELVGRPLLSFLDGGEPGTSANELRRRLMGERLDAVTTDVSFVHRRGAVRPARLTLAWLPEPDAAFLGTVTPLNRDLIDLDGGAGGVGGAALTERAPDLIWRLRLWPEPAFEYVSASSRDILGYPPSAFYGDAQLMAHLAADEHEQAKLLALYEGEWNPHETLVVHLVHRDGRVVALEQRTTGILDGERRVLAIEAISRDVTGRNLVGSELLAEVAVRRVLDDVEGVAQHRDGPAAVLRGTLDAVCAESGWTLGHALLVDDQDAHTLVSAHVWPDSGYDDFRHSTDARQWPIEGDLAETAVITGETLVAELDSIHDSERARAAQACGLRRVVVVPISVGDGVGAALELYADDTHTADQGSFAVLDRIVPHVGRIIERGREVEALRQMDEARTEFVTRAAHELRGPIGSIAVMASALAIEARRSGTPDLTGSLDRLAGQAERIQRLATRLLALSQLEQGRLDVSLEVVALRDAVEQAVGSLLGSRPPVTIDVDRHLKVLADPFILDEVLTNLLANAERHGGPHVDVSAVEVGRGGRRQVAVSVVDDGPGVDPSLVPYLFQPLRHSLASPTRSGLGLALVRQMAITLGGEVAYEPVHPNGARFTFFLTPA